MSLTDPNELSRTFDRAAYSRFVFPAFKMAFTLKRAFRSAVGQQFAINPDVLFPKLEKILEAGRMSPMNASAFICVNSNGHETSRHNPVKFLKNFLALYSAKTWQECCEIEGIKQIAPQKEMRRDYELIHAIGLSNRPLTERLERIKAFCWVRDLDIATRPINRFFALFNSGRHIPRTDVYNVLNKYNKEAADALNAADKLKPKGEKKDLTALPKDEYLPLMRIAAEKGNLSHTQCAIMMMFILHSRQERNGGGTYISHPVAVAKLVIENGSKYLGHSEGRVWMAAMVALLHDGWEENGIENIGDDLRGLLPVEVIEAVQCLHKPDGEDYFAYLQRIAKNPLAATVKLYDIYHNSSDMGKNPSSKQAFVYPLSAAYLEFMMKHPNLDISVAEFCERQSVCSVETFSEVCDITRDSEKRKKRASEFPHLYDALKGVKPVEEIVPRVKPSYANTRREENATVHP